MGREGEEGEKRWNKNHEGQFPCWKGFGAADTWRYGVWEEEKRGE